MIKNKGIFSAICSVLLFGALNYNIVFAQDTTERLAGSNRYETSIAISKAGWEHASTVIIASGLNYADALAASSMSKSKDAPILLTAKALLDPIVIAELKRLQTTEAFLIGGTGVIGTDIEKQLKDLGVKITRIGGTDRYDTSKKVAEIVGVNNGIIMSSDSGFADSLSIATIASIKSIPILISPKNSLNQNIATFIKGKSIPTSYIVGGKGVLGDSIDTSLVNSKRLSGTDRYLTNLSINNEFADTLDFNTVYLASGNDFPDALGGAALAAKNNAPIFLTDKNSISVDVINFFKSKNIRHVVILGGIGVVSENVNNSIKNAIKEIIIHAEAVSLNKTQLSLEIGESDTLIATVIPNDAVEKTLNWKSSNNDVVVVDSKGIVKAVRDGTALITATTLDGNKVSKCEVTVTNKVIALTLNKSKLELKVSGTDILAEGSEETLISTITPSTAINKEIIWTSSNVDIIKVDGTGKVTAEKVGTAIITATTSDGSKFARCSVNVTETSKVTGITLNKSEIELTIGETDSREETLIATIIPNTVTNKEIIWVSSDSNIANIDNTGKVTARKAGSAIITATTSDGNKSTKCNVTVNEVVTSNITGITLDKSKIELTISGTDIVTEGSKATLIATITPDNVINKGVIWVSSNHDIVTVDSTGKITAGKAGSAIITAITSDGSKTATCDVVVKIAVVDKINGLKLKKTVYNLIVGQTDMLIATVLPSTANSAKLWTSSDNSVVKVNNKGKITAIAEGTALIKVSTADGSYIAKCTITVKAKKTMVIAIDIGHNANYDTGANGIKNEDVVNKEVGTIVISKLRDLGYTVIDCSPTNPTSTKNSLKQRCDIANAANANYFMSIHFNKFNGLANGSEIFIGSDAMRNKAQEILTNLSSLGYINRRIVDDSNLYVLNNTDMPAMLVECAFLDSVSDMNRYDPNAIADALVNGLIIGD